MKAKYDRDREPRLRSYHRDKEIMTRSNGLGRKRWSILLMEKSCADDAEGLNANPMNMAVMKASRPKHTQ